MNDTYKIFPYLQRLEGVVEGLGAFYPRVSHFMQIQIDGIYRSLGEETIIPDKWKQASNKVKDEYKELEETFEKDEKKVVEETKEKHKENSWSNLFPSE